VWLSLPETSATQGTELGALVGQASVVVAVAPISTARSSARPPPLSWDSFRPRTQAGAAHDVEMKMPHAIARFSTDACQSGVCTTLSRLSTSRIRKELIYGQLTETGESPADLRTPCNDVRLAPDSDLAT
jgi:hypothetical protein